MRILCLINNSFTCEPIWRSLLSCGYEVSVKNYQTEAINNDGQYDCCIYIGDLESYPLTTGWLQQLTLPLVHICCDGGLPDWQNALRDYRQQKVFKLQVNVDGNPDTFCDMTKLGLVDPRVFQPKPWHERRIKFGHYGNVDEIRKTMIRHLQAQTCGFVSYPEMAAFLCDCQFIINCGTHYEPRYWNKHQVKWRVVEVAYAGACLVEVANPVVELYFEPNKDYWNFDNGNVHFNPNTNYQQMAERLHDKVLAQHSPAVFWQDVLRNVRTGD